MGQRPTLPPGLPGSTIGAGGLNFSVRNGKRCNTLDIDTRKKSIERDKSFVAYLAQHFIDAPDPTLDRSVLNKNNWLSLTTY